MKQKQKAELFRKMHDRSGILVLPNAWDAASARIFELAGFPAVGTTSAGIAASLGYPDREQISRGEMAKAVSRIAGAVKIPVNADVEAGYGPIPKAVQQTVAAVIEAGAAGINFEDGTRDHVRPLLDPDQQCERIRIARDASKRDGGDLVINARTDVFLIEFGAERKRFDHAVRRANAYRAAGADCLFIPGVTDEATIQALVKAVDGPLNVLAGPGMPPVAKLKELGVARVSLGSGPYRAALALTRRIAMELRDAGTYASFTNDALPYDEVNALFK